MSDLVAEIQTDLDAQSITSEGTGWSAVRRRFHDGQNQLVVITEDGGDAPEIADAASIGSGAINNPAVQILVRGEPRDSDGSFAKAQQIFDRYNGKTNLTLGSSTYLRVVARTSQPIFVGFDDEHRPTHSLSLRFATAAIA